MTLKFYLISTLICIIIALISLRSMSTALKRDGYESKTKRAAWEWLHASLPIIIPIVNMFLALYLIFRSDDIISKTKLRMDKEKLDKV